MSIPPLVIDLFIPSGGFWSERLAGFEITQKILAPSFIFPFALSQLFSGFLIDRWGVRRVSLTFSSIFLLATFGMNFCQSSLQLIMLRICQGIGGGYAPATGQYIVKKISNDQNIAANLGKVGSFVSLVPLWSPLLGEFLIDFKSSILFLLPILIYGLYLFTYSVSYTHLTLPTKA